MQRQAIGVIALVLLLAAGVLWFWPLATGHEAVLGGLVRVGAVMAALWLAYPDVKRLPAWGLAVIPVLLVLVAVKPRWFLILAPLVIMLAVLGRWGKEIAVPYPGVSR